MMGARLRASNKPKRFKQVRRALSVGSLSLVILFGAVEAFSYSQNSGSFKIIQNCSSPKNRLFRRLESLSTFFTCLENGDVSSSKEKHFLLFVSDVDDPKPSDSGHGFIVLTSFKSDPREQLLLTKAQAIHWGPVGEHEMPVWYKSTIHSIVPESLKPASFELGMSMSRPGGFYPDNDRKVFASENGIRADYRSFDDWELYNIFRDPKVVLAVQISEETLSGLPDAISHLEGKRFHVFLRDCTVLLKAAAEFAGLYVPPKGVYISPAEMIKKMFVLNMSTAE